MAALTAARNTQRLAGERIYAYPVAASAVGFQGGIACINAAGLLVRGSTTTGLMAVGKLNKSFDNSAGGASAFEVEVEEGIFLFNNSSAADLIAVAETGDDCYIVDDNTVAKTDGTGTRSKAGKIVKVTSAGVFVKVGLIG